MGQVAAYFLRRLLHAAGVIVLVATLVFALDHLAPGDPFDAAVDPQLSAAQHAQLRAQWGYDQPLVQQYVRWATNFARGNFGWSQSASSPVSAVLRTRLPITLLLMIPSVLLGVLAGVALGTWQAARQDRLWARMARAATLVIISIPDFVLALVVFTLFALKWRLAPAAGIVNDAHHDSMSLLGRVGDVLAHLTLPCLTLAVIIAASISRYHRTAMLDVLQQDFLRTARAKGASELRVVLRHALRNSLGPVIVIGGLLLPVMFAGAVFVEKIFGWPGMGLALVVAIDGRDYALVQAIALVGTALVAASAVLADVIAVLVNPRTSLGTP